MRSDGWGRESPLPKANPLASGTPARDYSRPEVARVSVRLEADDPSFAPGPPDRFGSSEIYAKLPAGSMMVPEGGSAVVDCGFSLSLPPGYRVRAASLVQGLFVDVQETDRFRIRVMNLGAETILNDGQRICSISVEPVCFFDWDRKD